MSGGNHLEPDQVNIAAERLRDGWRECRSHTHHLDHALASLQPHLPLTAECLERLDDESIQDLDQFVLRFARLQDAMGRRLLPSVLSYLQEPYEDRPMLDKLHRLEKLGYVESAEEWQRLRAIRNGFARDYPDDPAKRAALVNMAVAGVAWMKGIMERIGAVAVLRAG